MLPLVMQRPKPTLSRTPMADTSRRKGWKGCGSCSAAMPAPRLVTATATPSGARSMVTVTSLPAST
jgi:hypothetical protein